jgi:hypothetical protein
MGRQTKREVPTRPPKSGITKNEDVSFNNLAPVVV